MVYSSGKTDSKRVNNFIASSRARRSPWSNAIRPMFLFDRVMLNKDIREFVKKDRPGKKLFVIHLQETSGQNSSYILKNFGTNPLTR